MKRITTEDSNEMSLLYEGVLQRAKAKLGGVSEAERQIELNVKDLVKGDFGKKRGASEAYRVSRAKRLSESHKKAFASLAKDISRDLSKLGYIDNETEFYEKISKKIANAIATSVDRDVKRIR